MTIEQKEKIEKLLIKFIDDVVNDKTTLEEYSVLPGVVESLVKLNNI